MKKKCLYISIIVPVYNVEKYLEECILSVINQSYRFFELILVDDGSTDKSGIICDKYALNDKRIKVKHIKNSGVSKARNVGIDVSKYDYLCFIDSDDIIDGKYLFSLLQEYQDDIMPVCRIKTFEKQIF